MTDWSFDAWPPIDQDLWRFERHQPDDHTEFHVDLGCGTVKKGRIGVDRFPARGVNVTIDMNTGIVWDAAEFPGEEVEISSPPAEWGKVHINPHNLMHSYGLPFGDSSIRSIVTHHCLEHIADGFIPLMDDVYRVLVPGGLLRVIVPLFPSRAAVGDQDHKRWFMEDSFDAFCGHLGSADNPTGCWLDSFSVPYTRARFTKGDVWTTPFEHGKGEWGQHRELRVSLRAVK